MVKIGHWTAPDSRTGCTVVLFDPETTASGEVRGGAPATREFALLDPRRLVEHVDAVVLTGGSAFGLATADGVMAQLRDDGRGFATRAGPVPIVVAMGLFDLREGVIPPDATAGRHAVVSAAEPPWQVGRIGAGAGATVGKWRSPDAAEPGGLGYAKIEAEGLEVHALIAVNAAGDIDDGSIAEAALAGQFQLPSQPGSFENTTIGVVWTNADLDKLSCRLLAESGHDGFGRALMPAHMQSDGDAIVAASVGDFEAPLSAVRVLTTVAVEQAVRSIVPR